MQKLVETRIEIDAKITAGEKLPETMILYAVDSDHFIIAAKRLKTLEENALAKTGVKIVGRQNRYAILLPPKIFNFYHLDENDFTVMSSDKDPTTIIVTI